MNLSEHNKGVRKTLHPVEGAKQHLLLSSTHTHSLLGHVRLTRGSNSLTLLGLDAVHSLTLHTAHSSLPLPPLSSVVPREGVPPPYSEGHQPRMLFIPLSLYIHHAERLCSSVNAPRPEAESGSVCTSINTLLSSRDAFEDVSLICRACSCAVGIVDRGPDATKKIKQTPSW